MGDVRPVPEHLVQHITDPSETRAREYKQSVAWGEDKELTAKLIKTILAMANLPDGGVLVVGVREEPKGHYHLDGVTPEHERTWQPDHVQEKVNRYAEPAVALTVSVQEREGKRFVFVEVEAFAELPVICRGDLHGGDGGSLLLAKGRVYTRSRRKHETVEVRSQEEMREILERAADLQVRKLMRRGLLASTGTPRVSDDDRFAQELAAQTNEHSGIRADIEAAGHWRFVVRPATYEQRRFRTVARLEAAVRASQVMLRGWDCPHIPPEGFSHGQARIETAHRYDYLWEDWQFTCSGQTAALFRYEEDLVDKRRVRSMPDKGLWITSAIYRVTEVILFASRLAGQCAALYDGGCRFEMDLTDTRGRELCYSEPRHLLGPYTCTDEAVRIERDWTAAQVEHESASVAMDVALELFEHFGRLDPPRAAYEEDQRKLLERRLGV